MKIKDRFSIVEFTNPSGAQAFRVTGRKPDGTRVRKNFTTYSDAVSEKSRLEVDSENLAISRVPKVTGLSDKQLQDAEAAFRMLGPDISIVQVARFYLENYREPVRQISLREAFEQFMADKEAANCRPLTIRNLRARIGRFTKSHGRKLVGTISADVIRDHIFKPGLKPSTKDNNRRAFSSFFSWAEKRGYCKPSPMREIGSVHVDREEPIVLPRESIQKLLSVASSFRDGTLVPAVVLGVFAAIRPHEIAGLDWSQIDLEEKLITISSSIAKMRQRRLVEISDNLAAWLRPHARKSGSILPQNSRRDFDTIKALAGYAFTKQRVNVRIVEEAFPELDWKNLPECPAWTPDVLRHTAISYHLARHQHEGKTATWGGNSPDIIQKHYKGLVKPKDAAWFWKLTPDRLLKAA
jgi:integrase